MVLALCDEFLKIPNKLRVKEVDFTDQGKTLKVFISGSTKRIGVDPELSGPHGFVHLTKVKQLGGRKGPWPEKVEVYTNEKRGYPGKPLQVWLAGKPLGELELVQ